MEKAWIKKMIFFLFLIRFLCAKEVSIDIDENTVLNTIALDHPYICSNFDWWPDAKVIFIFIGAKSIWF